MAREDRPYLPWYYKDWLTSPDRFGLTYEQRGVYRDLLDYAWDQRGLLNDPEYIRGILGLDKRKFSLVWTAVSKHFTEVNGRLVNPKQERVRAEMDAYRLKKQNAGKQGGRPKAEPKQNESTLITNTETEQKPSLAFASSSSKPIEPDPPCSTPSVGGGGLIVNSLTWTKQREKFAHFGPRLRIPHVLHDELRAKLGGENPTVRLLAWYQDLDAEVEHTGEPIPDVFVWLRPKFVAWAQEQAVDADLARFRPKGA